MKKISLLTLIFFLLIPTANSETVIPQNNKVFFNTERATEQFDEINQKLAVPKIKLKTIIQNVQKLEALQDQAEVCVNKSVTELKNINELLKSSQIEQSILIQQTEYKYLQKKKLFYAKQLSECRFYVYRSKEALVDYKDTIQKLSTHKVLARSTPIWKMNGKNIYSSLKEITIPTLYSSIIVDKPSLSKSIFGLLIIGLGVLTAIYLRALCRNWLHTHPLASKHMSVPIAVFATFIIPLTFFGITGALSSIFFVKTMGVQILGRVSYCILYFILLFALLRTIFYPPYHYESPVGIPRNIGKPLYHRATILLIWVLAGILSAIIFNGHALPSPVYGFFRLIYLTLFIGLIAWVSFSVFRLPILQNLHNTVFLLLKTMIMLLLISMVLMEWIGFHQFAIFTITSIFLTMGLLFLSISAVKLIKLIYSWLDDNQYQTARGWRNLLGVKPHKTIQEILLLKYISYLAVLYVTIIFLMQIWGASPNLIDLLSDGLTEGFVFAEAKYVPKNIVIALITFALILLFGRFLATIAAKKERFEGETDTQVAIASVIVYITFAIALLFSLLIMGVNFTGLAIIAGALSVGVGLGLQNIVNNFVSGLILLLEKPIKPGDRVIVGSTEGFVKKVRLRSTQITTLAKEDVIVPNADLITNQVTNYMFRDRHWRVVCQVGVAYGSAIDLVKNVLLEVASKHPEVFQKPPNQPTVIFKSFGDSSLIFELWCIIHDVNKKFIVASDLHFSIDEAFKAHKITIAFPQRDIHIKDHV